MRGVVVAFLLAARYACRRSRCHANGTKKKLKEDAGLFVVAGCTEEYRDIWMGAVHVHDAAVAHVLVFESPAASGRHICAQSISHWSDFAAKVAELYPEYKVPK